MRASKPLSHIRVFSKLSCFLELFFHCQIEVLHNSKVMTLTWVKSNISVRPTCATVPVRAHRPSGFLWSHQVVPAPRHQVSPAVFLSVMQRESIPRQTHQLGSDSHLQADEAGSWRPAVLLGHLLTQLPIPAKAGGTVFKKKERQHQ